jgi:hypothetical protein
MVIFLGKWVAAMIAVQQAGRFSLQNPNTICSDTLEDKTLYSNSRVNSKDKIPESHTERLATSQLYMA